MDTTSTGINGRFWGQWTVASAIGFAVGAMVSLPIAFGLGEVVMDATNETVGMAVAGALFGIFAGGGLGAGQQIVLKINVGWGGMWTLVSAAAAAIVWAIAFPLLINADEQVGSPTGAVIAILFGLALGTGQWLVLRDHLPQAGRWIVIAATSMALALGLAFIFDGDGRELLIMGVSGLLAGAMTGLGMAWLLREPASLSAGQKSYDWEDSNG
jgi:hypothetical protein